MRLAYPLLVRCTSAAWSVSSFHSSGVGGARLRVGGGRLSPFPPRWHNSSIRLFGSSQQQEQSGQGQQQVLVNTIDADLDWDDRIGLQNQFDNPSKGWQVDVEWRPTPYGAGLFAAQDIAKDTILRVGKVGVNLKEFQTVDDIEKFCSKNDANDDEYQSRLLYTKDYLWGFHKQADERGYFDLDQQQNNMQDVFFFGMWIPGNGLNHNEEPNTVYRLSDQGINLVALTDIQKDDELFDDYRRHGFAPRWLSDWARHHDVTLNFSDCNDFVNPNQQQDP